MSTTPESSHSGGADRGSGIRRPPSVDPIDRASRDRTVLGTQIRQIRGGATTSPPQLPSQPDDGDDLLSYGTNEWMETDAQDSVDNSHPLPAPVATLLSHNLLASVSSPEPGEAAPPYTPAPSYPNSDATGVESNATPPPPDSSGQPPTDPAPSAPDAPDQTMAGDDSSRPASPDTSGAGEEFASLSAAERSTHSLTLTDLALGESDFDGDEVPPVPSISTNHGADYCFDACIAHITSVKQFLVKNRRILRLLLEADEGGAPSRWEHFLLCLDGLNATVPLVEPDVRAHVETVNIGIEDLVLDTVALTRKLGDADRLHFEMDVVSNPNLTLPGFHPEITAAAELVSPPPILPPPTFKGKGPAGPPRHPYLDYDDRYSRSPSPPLSGFGGRRWSPPPSPTHPMEEVIPTVVDDRSPNIDTPNTSQNPIPAPPSSLTTWFRGLPSTSIQPSPPSPITPAPIDKTGRPTLMDRIAPPRSLLERLAPPPPPQPQLARTELGFVHLPPPRPERLTGPAAPDFFASRAARTGRFYDPDAMANAYGNANPPRPHNPHPLAQPQPSYPAAAPDMATDYMQFVQTTRIPTPGEAYLKYQALRNFHAAALSRGDNQLGASSPEHSERRGGESRDSSSSRPPASKKKKITVPKVDGASKRLYIGYRSRDLAPPPNRQMTAVAIQDAANKHIRLLLTTQPEVSVPLTDVHLRQCTWNKPMTELAIVLQDTPNKDAQRAVKGVIAHVLDIATFDLTARPHEYITGVVFHGVYAVDFDASNRPILRDAHQTLSEAILRSGHSRWTETLESDPSELKDVRWAPLRDGATSATLFVNFNDTSSAALANLLAGSTLTFDNGLRTCSPIQDKETSPQCGKCWRFGHRATQCRVPHSKCVVCGSGHETHDHDRFVDLHGAHVYPVRCVNCLLSHHSNSKDCDFAANKKSTQWIADAYEYMSHIDDVHHPKSVPGRNDRPPLTVVVPRRKSTRPPTPNPPKPSAAPPLHTNVDYVWRTAGEGSHKAVGPPSTLTQMGFGAPSLRSPPHPHTSHSRIPV
ncbi:hypothetical protein GSI_03158 [Ganoderma sinense ZZ0214-1]|uniref:Uncharacterized protein n=1 Tax=Ganoderma sinense ZZ0214-1 TaxID=1077348 RepID=A0A2G8SKW7_9APHY|nr:hypothetical protein GSI_03158 [Ganoderma sinense ZZ0214-1]